MDSHLTSRFGCTVPGSTDTHGVPPTPAPLNAGQVVAFLCGAGMKLETAREAADEVMHYCATGTWRPLDGAGVPAAPTMAEPMLSAWHEGNERLAFELWASQVLYPAGLNHPFLGRSSNGDYTHEWAAARWEAWRARSSGVDLPR